jgi:hypothetical protein
VRLCSLLGGGGGRPRGWRIGDCLGTHFTVSLVPSLPVGRHAACKQTATTRCCTGSDMSSLPEMVLCPISTYILGAAGRCAPQAPPGPGNASPAGALKPARRPSRCQWSCARVPGEDRTGVQNGHPADVELSTRCVQPPYCKHSSGCHSRAIHVQVWNTNAPAAVACWLPKDCTCWV